MCERSARPISKLHAVCEEIDMRCLSVSMSGLRVCGLLTRSVAQCSHTDITHSHARCKP